MENAQTKGKKTERDELIESEPNEKKRRCFFFAGKIVGKKNEGDLQIHCF